MAIYTKLVNYIKEKHWKKTLPKWFLVLGLLIGILGMFDASFLTYEYYHPSDVCPLHGGIINCGKVGSSQYAAIWHVPVAVLGLVYYLCLSLIFSYLLYKKNLAEVLVLLLVLATVAVLFSLWLLYVQIALIGFLCSYCLGSLLLSIIMLISDIYLMHEYHVADF